LRQIEYPRLNKMLNCGCPFKKEMKAKTQQCIYDVAIKELYGAPESSFSDAQLRNSICVGMEGFLKSFRTRAIFKQELKSKLIAWIDAIEKTYGLSSNNSVEMWPDFVEKDVGIELVKLLHARYPGITKNDLSKSLGVSKKTIQNYLRKLDPSLNESEQQTDSSPLRIGGHEMHVDIESEEVQLRGDRAYYTPNTLHPVVMQFNVTQVAATLMALQNAYAKTVIRSRRMLAIIRAALDCVKEDPDRGDLLYAVLYQTYFTERKPKNREEVIFALEKQG